MEEELPKSARAAAETLFRDISAEMLARPTTAETADRPASKLDASPPATPPVGDADGPARSGTLSRTRTASVEAKTPDTPAGIVSPAALLSPQETGAGALPRPDRLRGSASRSQDEAPGRHGLRAGHRSSSGEGGTSARKSTDGKADAEGDPELKRMGSAVVLEVKPSFRDKHVSFDLEDEKLDLQTLLDVDPSSHYKWRKPAGMVMPLASPSQASITSRSDDGTAGGGTHAEPLDAVHAIKSTVAADLIPEYIDEFDSIAREEEIVIGLVPEEELLRKEKELEEARRKELEEEGTSSRTWIMHL